jgi:hypothetical protein
MFALKSVRRPLVAALALVLALSACNRNGEPLLTPAPPPTANALPASPLRSMLLPDPGAFGDAGSGSPSGLAVPPNFQAPPAAQPAERVHVAHVLVMHTGSAMRQPSVTRSLDEARAFANQLLARARGGEDVVALARQFSDEPGHEGKGGDLGFITRGQTVAPFENAAFALAVGAVSDVVQTDFGFHVIKRIE